MYMKSTLVLNIPGWFICKICDDDCSKYDSKHVFFSNRSGSVRICDDCLAELLADGSLVKHKDDWYEITRPIGELKANLF